MTINPTESQIQISIVEYLSLIDGLGFSIWKDARVEILKGADSFFIDILAHGSRQTSEQSDFMKQVLIHGGKYAVVRSVDDVINALSVWGIG